MRILLLFVVVAWHVENFNFATGQELSGPSNSSIASLMTFTANSFKSIAKDTDNNIIYSPVSAWILLAMATFGSGGRTYSQLRSVLELSDDDMTTLRDVKSMIDDFANRTDYEMLLASQVFVNKSIQLKPYFPQFTDLAFGPSVQRVDFTESDVASKTINEWAALRTNNRTQDLVHHDTLAEDTSLLLVNVVHFKASWAHQFSPQNSVIMQFHVARNKIEEVPTMRITDGFVVGELPNAKSTYIQIPYKTKPGAVGLSMFVILPHEMNGLDTLVENFDRDFVRLFDIHRKRNVQLYLPKFTIESSIDPKGALIQMGIDDMFNRTSNFTYIADDRGLMVSKIIQRTLIKVDEMGSEAASIGETGYPRVSLVKGSKLNFIANHPFVCVIATDTKIPLFTAIITNPHENKLSFSEE